MSGTVVKRPFQFRGESMGMHVICRTSDTQAFTILLYGGYMILPRHMPAHLHRRVDSDMNAVPCQGGGSAAAMRTKNLGLEGDT